MSQASPDPNDEPSFEQAVRQLTEIVQRLERGDLPLEESVALFEQGVRLSAISQRRLDRAQKRVEELLHVDESGRARPAPVDTSGDT
jgi:exodeoxyribonuclease VII small subunit